MRSTALRRLTIATALAGVVLGSTPSLGSGFEVPTADFEVSDIRLSTSAITVSGMDLGAVEVRVTGGFRAETNDTELALIFGPPAPSLPEQRWVARLRNVDGTARKGTWSGTLSVPANASGSLVPTTLVLASCLDQQTACTPQSVTGPPLQVTGRHIPVLRARVRPWPLPVSASRYEVVGSLVDAETGLGFRTPVRVALARDTSCGATTMAGLGTTVTPDRRGEFRLPVTGTLTATMSSPSQGARAKLQLHCVLAASTSPTAGLGVGGGNAAPIVLRAKAPFLLKASATATPARRWVRLGSTVTITGRSQNNLEPVTLQRLFGRSAWRSVTTIEPGADGRFRLITTPPTKGVMVYRTYQAGTTEVLPTTSAIMRVSVG